VKDITVGDCAEIDRELQRLGHHTGRGRRLFYHLLREAGVLPEHAPPTIRAAVEPGPPSTRVFVGALRDRLRTHP